MRFLVVFSSVLVHLVLATATLCHSDKIDQPRVRSGLSLESASLANVRLRRACDNFLVPRRVDDGVVPLHRLVTGRESRHAKECVCVLPDERQGGPLRRENNATVCEGVSRQMDGKDKA